MPKLKVRIKLEELRISLGPCLAPGRFVTPKSVGTPIRPMSTLSNDSTRGARMKVAISAKRGSLIGLCSSPSGLFFL